MKVIKGSFAEKNGVTYSPPTAPKSKIKGIDWTDVVKNPARYTRGKLF